MKSFLSGAFRIAGQIFFTVVVILVGHTLASLILSLFSKKVARGVQQEAVFKYFPALRGFLALLRLCFWGAIVAYITYIGFGIPWFLIFRLFLIIGIANFLCVLVPNRHLFVYASMYMAVMIVFFTGQHLVQLLMPRTFSGWETKLVLKDINNRQNMYLDESLEVRKLLWELDDIKDRARENNGTVSEDDAIRVKAIFKEIEVLKRQNNLDREAQQKLQIEHDKQDAEKMHLEQAAIDDQRKQEERRLQLDQERKQKEEQQIKEKAEQEERKLWKSIE